MERIRPARPEDAEIIREIYAPFVQDHVTSFEFEVPSIEEMRNRITTISETHPYLVYEDEEGKVQGFAYAYPFKSREGYQWVAETSIYLSPDNRGKGLGTLLYARLLHILRELGFFKAVAGISGVNPTSVAFHEKFGFTAAETWKSIGNKFGNWVDATWYLLELRSTNDVQNPKAPLPFKEWKKMQT